MILNTYALKAELIKIAKSEYPKKDIDVCNYPDDDFIDAYDETIHKGKVELAEYLLDEYFGE